MTLRPLRRILGTIALTLAATGAAGAANAANGSLISATAIAGPPHMRVWKVVYQSQSLSGAQQPVSGLIVAPEASAPAKVRDVIAWAHPTTGIAEGCAPSSSPDVFESIPALTAAIKSGYVVAATDYPGLGTPEVHPYMIGVSEARSVIDSVRAARQLLGPGVSNRYVAWGHSQGGQAALFVGEIASAYAPELALKGIVAVAPPTRLKAALQSVIGTVPGRLLAAYALVSWSRVFDTPLDLVTRRGAIPIVRLVARQCASTRFQSSVVMLTARLLRRDMLLPQFWTSEPWVTIAEENSADPRGIHVPMLVLQGTKDPVVAPSLTQAFVATACASGTHVDLVRLDGGGHFWAGITTAPLAKNWIDRRFAETAPVSGPCVTSDVPAPPAPKW